MSESLTIGRLGDDWLISHPGSLTRFVSPGSGVVERIVADWGAEETKAVNIDSIGAYEAAAAKIHQLADAREGSPEAAELAVLIAAVRNWEERGQAAEAAPSPGNYKTPARPGQPGNEREGRQGPSPRSARSSGPHPPYDVNDREGAATEKHDAATSDHQDAPVPDDRPNGNVRST